MMPSSNSISRCRISVAILVFISLHQLVAAATKTFGASPINTRQFAFYPRGGGATSRLNCASSASNTASTSTLFVRRRRPTTISPLSSLSVQNVGLIKRRKKQKDEDLPYFDDDHDLDHYHPPDKEPSLEELRDELGPIGLLVSNTIELTVITVQSYITGGILGYIGGSLMSIPSTIFGKEMGSIASRFAALHTNAVISFKSWSQLSAAFSGFNNFVRLARGDSEDGWNAVWGSALAGAFLNRSGGPQAMIQGGATYAGFTYVMEKMFADPNKSRQNQKAAELVYTDVPLNDDW